MVRLARGAGRGHRGKMGRGRGGLPPPLMARNNVMPPPIPPPRMPPLRMRPLPPPGMRSPPFVPPIPPPLPPPHHHMRPPPPRLPPVPPVPPLRRNMPFHPRPPVPMFPPHGPIPRMPPPPIPPPLMRGRGRMPRGMVLRHAMKVRKLGVAPFKNRKGKKNKPMKDKTEGDFFCETCDRGFKTEEKYEEHCSEHVVCGIDGCTLTAHEKIIEKHRHILHETGLYKKVGKKNSPDDIADWIAERKRKYPTKKNIEEKVAEIAEMNRRGERIHRDNRPFAKKSVEKNKTDYKNEKSSVDDKTRVINQNTSGKRVRQRKNKPKPMFDVETEQEDSWRGSLPHFPGTDLFPEEVDDKEEKVDDKGFSDQEWENDAAANDIKASNMISRPVASVLSALLTAYGSASESSEDENDKEISREKSITVACAEPHDIVLKGKSNCIKPESADHENSAEVKNAYDEKDNDSGPEEAAILRSEFSLPVVTNNNTVTNINGNEINEKHRKENDKRGRKRKRTHNKNTESRKENDKKPHFQQLQRNFVPKKRLTLLQKLLEPEIRHERNVILQCVRYVVENNFFGIGQ